MSTFGIAFFLAVGVGAFSYSKLLHKTNNTRDSVIGATVIGIVVLIVSFGIFHALLG